MIITGQSITGPTLMFKGIWQEDYINKDKTAESPYKWRMATIHATETTGYGGQLRFSTKSSHTRLYN